MNTKTDQENFWSGEFGDEYIKRNENTKQIKSFSKSAFWG